MNKVILMGRLTRDPDIRVSQGESQITVARYTLAVDRRHTNRNDQNAQTADFISCVAFGKAAEFCEKYFHKGIKITISGHIQTGSYTNKDGQKIYTSDVVIEDQEFAEGKKDSQGGGQGAAQGQQVDTDGFMSIPDGVEEELPF